MYLFQRDRRPDRGAYDVSVIYDPSSFDDTAYRLVVGNNEPLGQMLDILNLIVPIEYTVQDRRVLIKRKR